MEEEKEINPAIEGEEPLIEEARKEELIPELDKELEAEREKYLRLYAEFETYKRKTARDKEELLRYANQEIFGEILPTIDNLETALKHAGEGDESLKKGVEMTLRELVRTLEKFGVTGIPAKGEPFNPEFHHAIAQVESADVPENTVVEEYRKGYLYNGKVLRASLVGVSKKTAGAEDDAREEINSRKI